MSEALIENELKFSTLHTGKVAYPRPTQKLDNLYGATFFVWGMHISKIIDALNWVVRLFNLLR